MNGQRVVLIFIYGEIIDSHQPHSAGDTELGRLYRKADEILPEVDLMHEISPRVPGLEEQSLVSFCPGFRQAARQHRAVSGDADDLCWHDEASWKIPVLAFAPFQQMGRKVQVRSCMRSQSKGGQIVAIAPVHPFHPLLGEWPVFGIDGRLV
ncbi:MAG: hypothetical protein A4E49_02043 [Methanosaeta sp. PtaU1.Bin112]|nr:MAG: hypothetical protein A4E49_02043 [Methanosaeta sp. PtaU1.Bin112]